MTPLVCGLGTRHDPDLPGPIASAYGGDHYADLADQCLIAHRCSLTAVRSAGGRAP